MKKDGRERLFEVMTRLDKTFKKPLNEDIDKTFKLNGEELPKHFTFNQYDKNGSLAVEIWDDEGPYASISTNLPESDTLSQNEFFLKNWGENELLAKELVNMGMLIPTGQESEMGAQSYKIKPEYSQAGGDSNNIDDEIVNEISREVIDRAAEKMQNNNQNNRADNLIDTHNKTNYNFDDFINNKINDNEFIKNIEIKENDDYNNRIIRIAYSNNKEYNTSMGQIYYYIDKDNFSTVPTLTRNGARTLSKIAMVVNPNTKYKNGVGDLKISGY